ncbi:MAG: glycosyl hydrolase [Candidatus Levybacteria bacterium]|nr:glycosyl hydrolase [Candidatus Levybacteria bacterium]
MRKFFGYGLIAISLTIIAYVFYANSQYKGITREFSEYTLLTSSWEFYKKQFINEDGRVIDYTQDSITTSEGQSYAMLRAVWIDDKESFDLVWKWTRENLKRPNDNLFGWRWGELENKKFGFLPNGGDNSATDADQDIALALIFASARWRDNAYQEDAKKILEDLWVTNTAIAGDKRYLIAGNWAQNENELVLNPSYFAPYAWRIFDKVDRKHDWNSMVAPAYEVLNKSSTNKLDKEKAVGLPPDWVVLDRKSGALKSPVNLGNFTTNYSFDALRTPWRVALDVKWNNDETAKKYLATMCKPLEEAYKKDKKIVNTYSHDGIKQNEDENAAMYSAALGCFINTNPTIAKDIYQNKIVKLYANDTNTFREDISYYDQNWLWFGAALYNDYLIPYD